MSGDVDGFHYNLRMTETLGLMDARIRAQSRWSIDDKGDRQLIESLRAQRAPKEATEAMISQKARYALKAVVALAKADPNNVVMIGEIAESENIPKKFLEQILLDLKHHGIVMSRRGKAGGYLLLKKPEQITFGEVLRIIDGPVAPLSCLSRMAYKRCDDCRGEDSCEVRHVFARVADATRVVLDKTSVADSLSGGMEKSIPALAG